MNLRNNVQLIGNLGDAPKITNLESGKTVANFSLATNESYKNAEGETVTSTQWHNCVAWGKVAEIAGKHLKKGDRIAISGKITYRKYDDKEGNPKTVTEIVINEILMLGNASGSSDAKE